MCQNAIYPYWLSHIKVKVSFIYHTGCTIQPIAIAECVENGFFKPSERHAIVGFDFLRMLLHY